MDTVKRLVLFLLAFVLISAVLICLLPFLSPWVKAPLYLASLGVGLLSESYKHERDGPIRPDGGYLLKRNRLWNRVNIICSHVFLLMCQLAAITPVYHSFFGGSLQFTPVQTGAGVFLSILVGFFTSGFILVNYKGSDSELFNHIAESGFKAVVLFILLLVMLILG